jgi:imidazolonepropionase-like amidohydrolase
VFCWVLILVACQSTTAPTRTPDVGLAERLASAACLSEDLAIALVGGTLIDGTGAAPVPEAALVIVGRCIAAVGPRDQVPLPADAQVIELGGATLLPGLINAHVHNAYLERNLRIWAQAGVTTVRDLGAPLGYPYFSKRDQLAAEPRNARVVSAGPLVTVPDGYPIVPNRFSSLAVTSPEDARQQIAQLADAGADVIKITFSSGLPTLSPQEAAAIVETAHEHGIPVSAHATNPHELKCALDAGVDDIAHMSVARVQDGTLRRMVQAGVAWVPTLKALRVSGADNLGRFIEAGGQVALGTDAGYLAGLEIGLPLDEMLLMQEAGMTPMQILVSATRNAAHVCRLEHELGTLEPGKLADVLVVEGNPLEDLRVLRHVRLVIHGGVIIRGE